MLGLLGCLLTHRHRRNNADVDGSAVGVLPSTITPKRLS